MRRGQEQRHQALLRFASATAVSAAARPRSATARAFRSASAWRQLAHSPSSPQAPARSRSSHRSSENGAGQRVQAGQRRSRAAASRAYSALACSAAAARRRPG
ncbi:hypothetical protein ACFVSN_30070 [Kitasatospora sp. NPDC057904]|uniref:hypothetical protein n=1 Tax=Kitasatospora sp. NPDC057904 TaxID=3346275 RepID=UPI0036DC24C2